MSALRTASVCLCTYNDERHLPRLARKPPRTDAPTRRACGLWAPRESGLRPTP